MRTTRHLMAFLLLAGACTSGDSSDDAGVDAGRDLTPIDAGALTDGANLDEPDLVEAPPCLVDDDGASAGEGAFEVGSRELTAGDEGATVYYPAAIAESACTFAVIGWGNGTSSSGGDAYPEYFERLASHGFVVAVAHTNSTLSGTAILDTAAQVIALNDDPESLFFGKLRRNYGVMGKSQGAIAAGRDVETDPRAVAAVLVAGSRGTVTRPALFATGSDDFLRDMTFGGFESATDQAVYAEANDLDHLELDDSAAVPQLATSFMRCHLHGDETACSYIACADCQVEPWAAYQVK